MMRNTITGWAMKGNGIAVIVAVTTLLLTLTLISTTLNALTYYGLAGLNQGQLQWLTSEWFRYTIAGTAVSLIPIILYFGQPRERRCRFQTSSLSWANLWGGFLVALRAVCAFARNNVPAGVFFAFGAVAIGMMWVGVENNMPALRFNGGLLTLAITYLGVWAQGNRILR